METGQTRVVDGVEEEEYLTTGIAGWVALGVGAAAIAGGIVLLVIRPGGAPEDAAVLRLARGVLATW